MKGYRFKSGTGEAHQLKRELTRIQPVGNQIAADTALKDRTKIHVLVRQSRGVYIR